MNSIWSIVGDARATALAAGLPLSYRIGADPADVVLADGAGAWAEAAIRRSESNGDWTVVIDPGVEEAARLDGLIAATGEASFRIALAETYAGNPVVAPFRAALPPALRTCNLHARTAGGLREAAFAQVRLARALGFESFTLRDLRVTPDAVLVTFLGRYDGDREVTLRTLVSRTRAEPTRHDVRVYSADVVATLTLFDAGTARPAEAFVVDADGSRQLPTLYETAARQVLRGLKHRTPTPADTLRDLAADAALVRSLALD